MERRGRDIGAEGDPDNTAVEGDWMISGYTGVDRLLTKHKCCSVMFYSGVIINSTRTQNTIVVKSDATQNQRKRSGQNTLYVLNAKSQWLLMGLARPWSVTSLQKGTSTTIIVGPELICAQTSMLGA